MVHDAHRKAAEQHELAARTPIVRPRNITQKGLLSGSGIRSERWSTRIRRTRWPRKPSTSQDRWLLVEYVNSL